MRLLATYGKYKGRWHLSLLREDAQTPAGQRVSFASEAALVNAAAKMRGDAAQVRSDLRRWGQGSAWLDLSPAQCRFFGIQ